MKMEDQHRQGKREDLASVDVYWWDNQVCQPGQAASEVSKRRDNSHERSRLQPLKKQLMRSTCPLAEVSSGDLLGLEGTQDGSCERVGKHIYTCNAKNGVCVGQ